MIFLKKILISLFAMASFASAANAAEVVNPFYGPEPGHALSKTIFDVTKIKSKDGYQKTGKTLQETIYYGINDAWALYFDASNTWNDPKNYNKYEVRYWDIGIGYFFEPFANSSLDMELYYGEEKTEGSSKMPLLYWYSRFDFLKNKKTKPFIGFEYSRDLIHFTKNDDADIMTFFAGVWTKFKGKILLKGSVYADYYHSFPERTQSYFEVETGYQFTDNFAATVYGNYDFYNHSVQNVDIDTTIGGGILLKYLF